MTMDHAAVRRSSPLAASVVCLLLLVLALAGCKGDGKAKPIGPIVDVQKVAVFSSFDSFNEALAKRITERITGEPMPDFLVVAVQGAAFPVGTLLRQSPLIPVTASACQPPAGDPEVMSTSAPTLFPTYSMTRRVAANLGLDEAVFQGIAKAGVSAAQSTGISLAISDTTLDIWTDNGLTAALSSAPCRKALKPGATYRLVRGVVKGKREFSFSLNRTAKTEIGVSKVANFQAEIGGGGSTMKVSDPTSATFAMIVSEVTVPQVTTEQVRVSAPSAAPSSTSDSLIFVQQDSADIPANGNRIVTLLQEQHLNVASLVERIPTSKMPSSPQVRYFRSEDEAKAQRVLDILRKEYPEAKLVALRIPAPAGHVEVWLRRAS